MTDRQDKRAVVLLSGGMDSATTLAVARRDGYLCHALTFDYGQRHRAELDAAGRIASALGAVEHRILRLPLDQIGGSALTDPSISVPKQGTPQGVIPPTYVPARNTIFLAFGLAVAESVDADALYIGVTAVDYSGYPDCRPEFIEAFARVAAIGTKRGLQGRPIRVVAPLVGMSKAQILRLGTGLGVDYSLTVSCYDPDEQGRACGACDSCRLRRKGFLEAGLPDPTRYRTDIPNEERK